MVNLIVPNNLDDTTVLKRFLTQLVTGLGSNPFYTGNVEQQNQAIIELLQNNPTLDFFNTVSQINELRSNILTYVEDNVETIVKQNTKDIALIAEQFGTFSEQALAASWYGLSVKAGGAVAGLEVGSLDPDITTPGDESSYFRIIADNFILGRAYEDLTQEEKNYLAANNLPSFGTVYNAQKQPVPALITSWDNTAGTYKHYFNGIVQFSNIQNADYANAINNGTTTINGGKITTNTVEANVLKPSTGGTTVWSGGGLVSENFNGNPYGNIGSPTQGFRLSSNAAGTGIDPNIYGAYIKGGIIEGSNLWLSTPAGYAKVQHLDMLYHNFTIPGSSSSTTIYSSYIELVSPTYGSGYKPNRVFSLDSSKISVITSGANSLVKLSLQYSADGGSWTKLDQFSGSLFGVNVLYHGLCPNFNSTLRIRLAITYANSSQYAYTSAAGAALTLINQN